MHPLALRRNQYRKVIASRQPDRHADAGCDVLIEDTVTSDGRMPFIGVSTVKQQMPTIPVSTVIIAEWLPVVIT